MTGSRCNRLTRRAAAILLAATLLVAAAAGDHAHAQSATVRLVVDYGDGVIKTITALPWAKGSTVLDVMNAAKDRPHGITTVKNKCRLSHCYCLHNGLGPGPKLTANYRSLCSFCAPLATREWGWGSLFACHLIRVFCIMTACQNAA